MTSPMHNRIEQAMAELEQQKVAMAGFEREMSAARTTVTSKNRAVTVTINGQGELTEIRFPTGAYRTMAPAELGQLLVDTVTEAQREARERAAQLFATLLPAGVPVLDMLTGPVDFESTMSEVLRNFSEAEQGLGDTQEGGAR